MGPKSDHVNFIREYGMPSGPGDESLQESIVLRRSWSVSGLLISSIFVVVGLDEFLLLWVWVNFMWMRVWVKFLICGFG